ncbi:MAG: DotA/TraY family protein [Actinomycetaceae bacterium]|nr:DotA/TraY family protein [Actinomycetaceae bacterium]
MATIPFAPPQTDHSVYYLYRIFGEPVWEMVAGNGENVQQMELVGALMNTFNIGILIIAGIIASYIAIVGTANTANDGKALGKQWSSTWTSLRIVGSAAVLLPTATGYSFLQLFILACALWGVNLANQIYDTALSQIFISKTMLNHNMQVRARDYSMVQSILQQHLCAQILGKYANKKDIQLEKSSGFNAQEAFNIKMGETTSSNGTIVAKNSICGSITYTPAVDFKEPDAETKAEDGALILPGLLKNASKKMRLNEAKKRIELMASLHVLAKTAADKFMTESSACFINQSDATDIKDDCLLFESVEPQIVAMLNAVDTLLYDANVQRDGNTTLGIAQNEIIDALKDSLSRGGWIKAPGWFQDVSSVMQSYYASIGSVPVPEVFAPEDLPFYMSLNRKDPAVFYANASKTVANVIENHTAKKENKQTASKYFSAGPESGESTLEIQMSTGIKQKIEDARKVIDNFPIYIISVIMPDYDFESGIDYTTASKNNDNSVGTWIKNRISKLAQKAKAVYSSVRLGIGIADDEDLYTLQAEVRGWFAVCQKSVMGMGASLFRVQCSAETALHVADLIAGATGKIVQQSVSIFKTQERTAKTMGTVGIFAQILSDRAPMGTKMGEGFIVGLSKTPYIKNVMIELGQRLESFRIPLTFVAAGLPILPYFVFIFGVIGWILGVIQALVAAPLWACLHMTPGQSFIGSERQGYMLLLSLFIRPALLITSLILSFWVCDPLIEYYTDAFIKILYSVGPQSLVRDNPISSTISNMGLFYGIVSEPGIRLMLFFVGLMTVFTTVFTLSQSLPNAVLRWLNMNVDDLGSSQGADVLKSRTARGVGSDSYSGNLAAHQQQGQQQLENFQKKLNERNNAKPV